MSNHWDYGPDKTKAERRERGREKKKERMEQGKRAKMLHQLIMERAKKAQKEYDEREAERTEAEA